MTRCVRECPPGRPARIRQLEGSPASRGGRCSATAGASRAYAASAPAPPRHQISLPTKRVVTGSNARASRNTSDAAVNCGLARQTITAKGRRLLSAPTRSLRDLLVALNGSCGGRPKGLRASLPPSLYCRGVHSGPRSGERGLSRIPLIKTAFLFDWAVRCPDRRVAGPPGAPEPATSTTRLCPF